MNTNTPLQSVRTHSACLTVETVDRLGAGDLTPAETAAIEEHLCACAGCRDLLERSACDPHWQERFATVLRSPGPEPLREPVDREAETLELVRQLLGPTDDPDRIGRIGGYEVCGVLGRGGTGIVFKAFDPPLNRYVAVKLLLPHLAASGTARRRFAREGRAAAAVIDDHVLPIYSVAEWREVPYLVTQYCSGGTLQSRIDRQGPLELKEILRIARQTARGLAAAHAQGLVHRDVKPSNILLDGTVERCLLTDFGLARTVDDASITVTGQIAGTPHYMSPEQARGDVVDARSDLFGLGCVMYAMCTGRPPFRAANSYAVLRLINDHEPEPIRHIAPEIPVWLCDLISRLMAKRPEDRFQDAQEVADLLETCLAHVQQPDSTPLPLAGGMPNAQRQRGNIWRRAGLLLAGVTCAGGLWLASGGLFPVEDQQPQPQADPDGPPAVEEKAPATVAKEEPTATGTTLYHPDRKHLWNRLHAALLIRTGPDGKEYGQDRLEPLLWAESDYLLRGPEGERALAVLDEFLQDKGETLIEEPLKRAVLQRDLWLVANWVNLQRESEATRRLSSRLVEVIARLALEPKLMERLPDNYAAAVASGQFTKQFDPEHPEASYLPPDLFDERGPWVSVGTVNGPVGPAHLAEHPGHPYTNSAFLVFLKLPGGREAGLEFLKQLAAFKQPLYRPNPDERTRQAYPSLPTPDLPQWPRGTEVALVRRAMLIGSRQRVVVSPLVESVQVRIMLIDTPPVTLESLQELAPSSIFQGISKTQAFAEFQLRRADLFAGTAGGLRDVSRDRDFKTGFNSHGWDEFARSDVPPEQFAERAMPFLKVASSCAGCHRFPGVYSFLSYHDNFAFGISRRLATGDDVEEPGYVPKVSTLAAMEVQAVQRQTEKWKQEQDSWKTLHTQLQKLFPNQLPGQPGAAVDDLRRLDQLWRQREQEYQQVLEAQPGADRQEELQARYLPAADEQLVDSFLKLEQRQRGQNPGLFALNYLMMRAAQVDRADYAVVRARDEALARLGEHYLGHPDLDLPLRSLTSGPLSVTAVETLAQIERHSSQPHVRAEALYIRAELVKRHADFITLYQGLPPRPPQSQAEERRQDQDRNTLKLLLERYNAKQARQEAVRLARQVIFGYPDLTVPQRISAPGDAYMPQRFDPPNHPKLIVPREVVPARPQPPRYAELAQRLLVELSQPAIGQTTPPLTGQDTAGRQFNLTDRQGDVVVLLFSAAWSEPSRVVYSVLRELQKQQDGQPVTVLSVLSDKELPTAQDEVNRHEITWRAVWDGENGPILQGWKVTELPTLYVIDQRGIIRHRNPPTSELSTIVTDLLREAK